MTDFEHGFSEEMIIVKHEGIWKIQVLKRWNVYNPVLKRWQTERTETEYRGLECWHPNGIFKVVEGRAIIKRQNVNPENLRNMEALFVIQFRVEADKTNPNEYVSEFKGGFYLHDLECSVSQPLHITDRRIKPIGKERKITESEALKLIKEKHLPVFSDFGKAGLVVELRS